MKLAGYIGHNGTAADVQELRALTVEELKLEALYRPVVIEARSRFKLFRILDVNYQDWATYVKSLLRPEAVEDDAALLNLERLLLNYLNCAYTLRAHFEASFQQRFRADGAEQKRYKSLNDALMQKSWPFAFFLDFRHYLQHRGLGIGQYKRTVAPTSVALAITLQAGDLLTATKDWPRSRLAAAKGVLELVPLLDEFHAQMMQGYAVIIVNTLFAELFPAAELFQKLAVEVRQKNPALRLAFRDGDRTLFPPNELFVELGVAGVGRK